MAGVKSYHMVGGGSFVGRPFLVAGTAGSDEVGHVGKLESVEPYRGVNIAS